MSLNPRLWAQLEAAGLSDIHLELVLLLLASRKNGHVTWHVRRGELKELDWTVRASTQEFADYGVLREVLQTWHPSA